MNKLKMVPNRLQIVDLRFYFINMLVKLFPGR